MRHRSILNRYLLRRDFFRRVKARLSQYRRRLVKSEEADLRRIFTETDPRVFIDVGANIGTLAEQFIRDFPHATVYALEPDPVPFGHLQYLSRSNSRVRAFPLAAADRMGELSFVQRGLSCNSSLLRCASDTGVSEHTVTVKATTLDVFCAQESLSHIDLLKIDTEGADLLVLRGAENLLTRRCVDVIMTEVFFVPIYEGQASFDQIAGFLKHYGFRIFNFYVAREAPTGQAHYGNAIFVQNDSGQIAAPK